MCYWLSLCLSRYSHWNDRRNSNIAAIIINRFITRTRPTTTTTYRQSSTPSTRRLWILSTNACNVSSRFVSAKINVLSLTQTKTHAFSFFFLGTLSKWQLDLRHVMDASLLVNLLNENHETSNSTFYDPLTACFHISLNWSGNTQKSWCHQKTSNRPSPKTAIEQQCWIG